MNKQRPPIGAHVVIIAIASVFICYMADKAHGAWLRADDDAALFAALAAACGLGLIVEQIFQIRKTSKRQRSN